MAGAAMAHHANHIALSLIPVAIVFLDFLFGYWVWMSKGGDILGKLAGVAKADTWLVCVIVSVFVIIPVFMFAKMSFFSIQKQNKNPKLVEIEARYIRLLALKMLEEEANHGKARR